MSSITHTQTKSLVNGKARVVDTVTAAVGLPTLVFVLNAEDDTFSRVASVPDLLYIPAVKTEEQPLYRVAAVTRDFDVVRDALDFATMLRDRLRKLPADYDRAAGFAAEVTETFAT